ncbi:TIGR03943 family putative permease subunit [Peribacillus butanolivorans]|uniref:TIGR03943 family putative permease subunit n=1 Tax=Peribacillus butanolivorans TaxID=421767 RepID=UPI0036B55C0A
MLYNFPGNFMDKTIEFDGSTFYGEAVSAKLFSVIRFRVIHYIADLGEIILNLLPAIQSNYFVSHSPRLECT